MVSRAFMVFAGLFCLGSDVRDERRSRAPNLFVLHESELPIVVILRVYCVRGGRLLLLVDCKRIWVECSCKESRLA